MLTIAIVAGSIILSIIMLEQIYEDTRSLDRDVEQMHNLKPDHFGAWAVAFLFIGGVWAFCFMLAAIITYVLS